MPEEADIASRKSALRKCMKEALAAMSPAERIAASHEACDRVTALPAIRDARTIMLYLALPGEADCRSLITSLLGDGRCVCVPEVEWESRSMRPVRLNTLERSEIVEDRHGVQLPRSIEPIPMSQLDVVIVPGIAFDLRGQRLGRGGGFYDRFLSRLNPATHTVALAFDRQIVASVPTATHDAAVRVIATESRLIACD